ncbi:ubiquitin-like-specific protease ESD4 [Impatiens glandulifera]|uniref:ubiquitin-like-specific protease ESD4 n=1 Tax=Impatiens glandulifera TaxID=253017 RepID=UPI001FB0F291|nr:ubiquitin-like-specific protease ESD4 [Impatiens glandulifera]
MVEQMGALTSNRKRGDYSSLNKKSPSLQPLDLADTHIAKKPKLSSPMLQISDRFVSAKEKTSASSRIYRYPEPINRLRREVHAPCRVRRFGFSLSCRIDPNRSSAGITPKAGVDDNNVVFMGNVLSSHNDQAKSYSGQSLRNWRKDKEVIDVDDDPVENDEEAEVQKEGGGEEEQDNRIEPILKVQSAEKSMQSLSIDGEVNGLNIPVHKKLLETAERRNSKLNSLNFLIETHEKRRAKLQLLRPVKKVEQEEEIITDNIQEAFVPLTQKEEADVKAALSNSNRRKLLVNHGPSNIDITGETIMCLRPKAWLNDEVINVYLELLKEREKREPEKFLKCHFFNTFFYKKLLNAKTPSDFKSLGRWTTHRKLGYHLVDCDKIFIPVHKEIHWCLAVINKKDQKFQYLDSLGGTDSRVLNILAKYYVEEVKGKSGQDIDVSKWKKEFVKDLPAQENGFDCGVFMIKYIDFYSRGVGLCFKQEDMPYFRLRTAKEILRLKAD